MWPDTVLHQMPVCPHVSAGTVHDNKLLKTGMHSGSDLSLAQYRHGLLAVKRS